MKKKTVAKLKVTRKLEGFFQLFLCCFVYTVTAIKRSYLHGNFFPTFPRSESETKHVPHLAPRYFLPVFYRRASQQLS
ncbi:hypothetical protein COM25_14685 [Bacillus wiedmannii]|uniref:Secreted protein n=1 Tax=Bacillus wiedmannii TaxID=1890302 RepID=A0ABD6TIW9_9BACI|nr:hypothetical protein CN560_21300 [Bacillus wiedmannii]PGC74674.1 hypothetical protein COM25_14685 [Bacillus wiedmannii]PHG18099.1 hypothetical protein COI74_21485 [Bacillus wiedmannii]